MCVSYELRPSVNLIAFIALTALELGERRIRPGDEVGTVSYGIPATVILGRR